MNNQDQLTKLKQALAIAQNNGNQLFINNIERDIAALEAGEASPIIAEYLTADEQAADNAP
ncbi:MAG: hypothetical protein ACPHGV_06695 [Synechococcus sp.]